MLKKSLSFIIFVFSFSVLSGQDIRIGEWRSHLSYNDGIKVAEKGDSIFCATRTGLFLYNKKTSEVRGVSKVDGFSDVTTKTIRYNEAYKMLFIAYQNTNIDILANNKIINVSDILRKGDIIGVKEINDFSFYRQFCFISTTFGIVKYNIERNEIAEDYREIGPSGSQVSIIDIAFYKDSIYAATPIGILSASLATNINLRDYRNWNLITLTSCIALDTFNNRLWAATVTGNQLSSYNGAAWQPENLLNNLAVRSMESSHGNLVVNAEDGVNIIYRNGIRRQVDIKGTHAILDRQNKLWLAVNLFGLIGVDESGQQSYIKPNGPHRAEAFQMYNYNDEIWVASGGVSPSWNPLYTNDGIYRFKNGVWENYNEYTVPGFAGFQMVINVIKDPLTERIWASSFSHGLMELKNDTIQKIYNGLHTPALQPTTFDTSRNFIKLAGMALDKDNNLWMNNYHVDRPIVVKKSNGQFRSFTIGGSSSTNNLTHIVADDYNQIWTAHPSDGIIVYNHNGTIDDERDDKMRRYQSGLGNGNLPANDILSLTKDHAGQIWIGTSNGLAVVYDPSQAFARNNSDAQQIWINNGKASGYLLSGEAVTSIAIDGGNRKWIGTRRGLWVTDSAGSKILWNFTSRNSPLISDNIRCLGINGKDGEVFIGTDKGIVSYRSDATIGGNEFTDVYAFPNPVKPGYEGPIAITGLARSSSVKITDITGNLVYETKSEGGTATWNGRNFSGEKANSGVYLVFCANSDGTASVVTKILVIR